jgi:hypothetical protein
MKVVKGGGGYCGSWTEQLHVSEAGLDDVGVGCSLTKHQHTPNRGTYHILHPNARLFPGTSGDLVRMGALGVLLGVAQAHTMTVLADIRLYWTGRVGGEGGGGGGAGWEDAQAVKRLKPHCINTHAAERRTVPGTGAPDGL